MPKNKKSSDVKNKILSASEELFAHNGYDATSIAQIAEKAKIAKSLLYYYFESKEQILEELFSNYLLKVKDEKNKVLSGELPKDESVRESMKLGFSLLTEHKNIIRILISEMLKGNVNKEPFCNIIKSIIPNSFSNLKMQADNSNTEFATFILFFGLAPLIMYMLFGETWRVSNNMEEKDFANLFAKLAIAAYSNEETGITAEFFEIHKDLLVENLKKMLWEQES